MAKEFKKWIDEFVENGANPKNVVNWPEEAGGGSGTKVVTELPQIGEEYTIYELHTTIPPKFNYVPCTNEMEFRYVFENEEAFRDFAMNIAKHYNNHNEFYCYCLAEDELIRVYYNSGSVNWTLFDNEEENVFIDNNQRLCICKAIIDEHTALLLNGKQVLIGDSNGILYNPVLIHQVKSKVLCDKYKFGMVFPIMNRTLPSCVDGVPSVLLMSNNFADFCTDLNSGIVQWVTNDGSIKVILPSVDGKYRYDKTEKYFFDSKTGEYYTGEFEWVDIENFNFKDYVDYETYNSIPLEEKIDKPFIFDPSGKSITSYWIYTNGKWFNADEIREFETQEKTVNPSTNIQEINPDEGYDGLSKVTVNAINLQNKTVNADTVTKYITHDSNYDGLRKVTINAVTSNIDANIRAENIKKDVDILGVIGTYEGSGGGATYNIETLQTVLPIGIDSMGVAQDGSNIYLFGGRLSAGGHQNSIYKFNTETGAISTLTTTLPKLAGSMGVAKIGGNVYLFGGSTNSATLNSIWKFNIATEKISTLDTTLPQELSSMGIAQAGSNVYIFGFYAGTNVVYKFNTETETISTLSISITGALRNMRVAQIGSNVYLFGVKDTNIYKFNTETETISTLTTTLFEALNQMGVAQIGSNIYLFGGNVSGNTQNSIYKFNTETGTISALTTTLFDTLRNMGVAQIGSDVYLFGGAIGNNYANPTTINKFSVNF